jgi:cysteine desulfurase
MHANNELGTINNIYKIAEIANKNNIPFHSDCVQTFGKYKLKLVDKTYQISAISASAHKFNGPLGVGFLILEKEFVEGYRLKPIIFGTQQYGLRGGTENIPAIFGSIQALYNSFYLEYDDVDKIQFKPIFQNAIPEISNTVIRRQKNIHLLKLSQYFMYLMDRDMPKDKFKLEVLGYKEKRWEKHLPNILLISLIGENICNVKMKELLEEKNIIVSIGSACNTSSKFASHVIDAIKYNFRKGILRISFGDHNTTKEVEYFVKQFVKIIADW